MTDADAVTAMPLPWNVTTSRITTSAALRYRHLAGVPWCLPGHLPISQHEAAGGCSSALMTIREFKSRHSFCEALVVCGQVGRPKQPIIISDSPVVCHPCGSRLDRGVSVLWQVLRRRPRCRSDHIDRAALTVPCALDKRRRR